MKQVRDALVIGSGIIGSATAFALTRLGVRRTTLIEKGPLVSGMTRRSAGLAHPFQPHPLLCHLAEASYDFYNQWAIELGGKNLFSETGAVVVSAPALDAESSSAQFAMWQTANLTQVTRPALAELFPGWVNNSAVALFSPRAGYADAVLTAQAMINAARERGLETQTGTWVKQLLIEHGRVKGVRTTTGDIESPLVVITAGAWAEQLLSLLGLALHLRYRRGALVFYEQPREIARELPTVVDAAGQYFLRPHPYHMAAGGSVELAANTRGVETLDDRVTLHEMAEINRFAAKCVPGLANIPPKRAHSILYETPGDEIPVLGAVPGVTGVYVGSGFGTSAFAVAPVVGDILAQMMIDGNAAHDVSAFSPMRSSLRNL